MLDTLATLIKHSADIGTIVTHSHTPQTAFVALLCAVLINFLD